MRRSFRSLIALAAILMCTAAQAQPFRAYIASFGSDANPCSVVEPCRLLPAALTVVANNGEIWMLDSANYNTATVNVTKSVTILAVPGAVGSVVAIGGPGITISTASVNVALRNLVLVPFPGGGGTDGVTMTNGTSLTVEDSVFSNFTAGAGMTVSTAARVKVTNTVIRNIGNGVVLSGGANANISHSTISNISGTGILVSALSGSATTSAVVSDSVVTQGFIGISIEQLGAGPKARVTVTNTTSSGHSIGISVTGTVVANAIMAVGNSTASQNSQYGMYNSGGTLKSLGNNFLTENTTADTNVAPTAVTPK